MRGYVGSWRITGGLRVGASDRVSGPNIAFLEVCICIWKGTLMKSDRNLSLDKMGSVAQLFADA